ncbi:transcriptional regulator [Sphaerisporangium melleum]|uniref:Transcriptional regulator n=1 Tax=Sphaerisporangium melleum TaxID=321316 RepID=A0A917VD52_9ACTN|nr:helix-turn-helix transcriptional regulator [Sphaerisporangium melleum]GGK64391.1 transcriptional regulator [Sphaerisporangium melleum]GII70089.1 transcriptional regulator [Sphaerisporangium melleum]
MAQGPSVRRRRLAGELRALRERAGLTGDQVAEAVGWSASKLSRMETARVGVRAKDLRALLDLYNVPESRREALLTLARTDHRRGWWDMYDSIPTEYTNYISLEASVSAIKRYDLLLVHGLLQTEAYARAIIRSGLMSLAPAQEVDRRVEIRLTRQEALRRPDPLNLWVVLDEAALRRVTGGPDVMRDQCKYLVEQAERPNVTIQVLPNALGAHPGAVGAFSIMEFSGRHDPSVVYVETMASSLYIEDDTDVHRYGLVFDQLRAMALGPDESLAMIGRIAGEL